MERLAIVTDAWHPQTNGVVNTLTRLMRDLERTGMEILLIGPDAHKTVPLPSEPDYQVACDPWRAIPRLRAFSPDAVHIATEGPLGLWTNRWLRRRGLRFTTSYHTRFPEYMSARFPIPLSWGYRAERWFHAAAECTFVGTQSLIRELRDQQVGRRLVHWPRGVDGERFHPRRRQSHTYPSAGPVWLYVGRVAPEKNLAEFLDLDLPGTKVVVGDGPARAELQRRYPQVLWRGFRYGDELAAHYASADCFVFPSRTDTFGNVILEALASGLPVAAVPAPGPVDLIRDGVNGALSNDLGEACRRAVRCTPAAARASSQPYTYRATRDRFRAHLVPVLRRLPVPLDGFAGQRAMAV